jgi:3-oxoadipate enol-lactonase
MAAIPSDRDTGEPPLPPGRPVELPGRGTTYVRELAGPPGAATLLLLHGWTATADLNWFRCYDALGAQFRVIALDQRGHGRGIRSRRTFRLADCADDAAALVDVLALAPVIAVGYSMGGPVAQLLWHRHSEVVAGLVLAATARSFSTGVPEERLWWAGLQGLALATRWTPPPARQWLGAQFNARRGKRYDSWAAAQVDGHQWRAVFEAGRDLGRFSSTPWIGGVDVATAVVVTERDQIVPPRRQERLAASIPGAATFRVDGDHDVCVANPAAFVPALLAACQHVAARAR